MSDACCLWTGESSLQHNGHLGRKRARPDETHLPECLAKKNVKLVRRLEVTVHHVDSYTGMIKYGYGGGGLTEGLKTQVTFLCQVLRKLGDIERLEVCYQCQDFRVKEETQGVLDPFLELTNVKSVVMIGHVTEQTRRIFEEKLPEARKMTLEKPLAEMKGKQKEETEVIRPPSLESNVKKGLAVYRGYDGREI